MLALPDAEVGALLDRLSADLRLALGDRLVGLYLYGPLVTGDFDQGRSQDHFAETVRFVQEVSARIAADAT